MPFDISKMTSKFKNLPENFVKICNPEPSKAGKSLMVLNTLGMLFAALSNTYAAASDKNTSPREKKFLIPAGIATGGAQIAIYYLMTDRIIKNLKTRAKETIENMPLKQLEDNTKEFALSSIKKAEKGFLGTKLFKKSDEYISSMKNTLFKNGDITGEITQKAKELYKDKTIAAGSVLGAFIGAVIGCSIITPIIRDISAYAVQKIMSKGKNEVKIIPQTNPLKVGEGMYSNAFSGTRRQPYSLSSYMASTRQNMKI